MQSNIQQVRTGKRPDRLDGAKKYNAKSFHKIKNLRLVTPERANQLGVPAEAPVLCSPYVHVSHCDLCNIDYKPLVYQIGQETVAHHFCKENGGGIYVQLPEDVSGQWTYYKGLFQAVVIPRGPIRMGNDRGYQFRSVTPKRIITPQCHECKTPIDHGRIVLIEGSGHNLIPVCNDCAGHIYFSDYTEWSFVLRDGALHFSISRKLELPANAGVIRRAF